MSLLGGLLIASDAIRRSRTATRPGMVEEAFRGGARLVP